MLILGSRVVPSLGNLPAGAPVVPLRSLHRKVQQTKAPTLPESRVGRMGHPENQEQNRAVVKGGPPARDHIL